MPTNIFFRNVMCIRGILELKRFTRVLSIIIVNKLTYNNVKMTYQWATLLYITVYSIHEKR
ncbi:hypothetical protein F0T03_18005 [Yersinia canariae]|uniref:Uncharacterized protein n=1 Tax=Yersinia canariae TaxID=2607663 RepID=A0A857F2D1_9GAMM|nr:hypothetical protein F0T03_18005 [Yersinia canariae]